MVNGETCGAVCGWGMMRPVALPNWIRGAMRSVELLDGLVCKLPSSNVLSKSLVDETLRGENVQRKGREKRLLTTDGAGMNTDEKDDDVCLPFGQ